MSLLQEEKSCWAGSGSAMSSGLGLGTAGDGNKAERLKKELAHCVKGLYQKAREGSAFR